MQRTCHASKAVIAICIAFVISPGYAQLPVEVKNQGGQISVQADDVTAQTLAQELSSTLGIRVFVTGDTQTRMSADIIDEPLDKAIGKLSPNNLLVRRTSDPNSQIVEVILMLAESGLGSSGLEGEQFLPSGSPADEIIVDGQGNQYLQVGDPAELRNPNRAIQARNAAEQAGLENPDIPPDQIPPMPVEEIPLYGQESPMLENTLPDFSDQQ